MISKSRARIQWAEVIDTAREVAFQVALTAAQVERYQLPEAFAKENDTRNAGFQRRFGKLVQVEVDALSPDVLRGLYQNAIDQYWDMSAYERVLAVEAEERAALRRIAASTGEQR